MKSKTNGDDWILTIVFGLLALGSGTMLIICYLLYQQGLTFDAMIFGVMGLLIIILALIIAWFEEQGQ